MSNAQFDFFLFGTFKYIAMLLIFIIVATIYKFTALLPIFPIERSSVADGSF